MKIKNVSEGPRGVHSKTGVVLIDPGQEVDVDISPEELASSKGTGWFEVSGKSAKADDPDLDATAKNK